MILTFIIVFGIYFCCPKYAKVLICVLNFMIPDQLPAIDEIVMVAGLIFT